MEAVVLDTSVASLPHPRKRRSTLLAWYEPLLLGKTFVLSFQSVAELLAWAVENRWTRKDLRRLERFLGKFVIVPYDLNLAKVWAKVNAHCKRRGLGDILDWAGATAPLLLQWRRGGRSLMWDLQKRQRFQELRARGEARDAGEQTELAGLVKELEADESAYLSDATQRLRQRRELTEKQNRSLEAIASRRQALVERLDKALVEAQAERRAIDSELALVLAGANKEE